MEENKSVNVKLSPDKEDWKFRLDETVRNLLLQASEGKQLSDLAFTFEKETLQLTIVKKDELINGKEDMATYIHPFFDKLSNVSIKQEKEILSVNKDDKILLFTPHPDDEILGAGILLNKCFKDEIDTTVVYMTNGNHAGVGDTRQREAINGIKIIGGKEENLIFTCFPFYQREDRSIQEDDLEFGREILRKYNQITQVYVCADVFDPNKTHRKCFDILTTILGEEEFKNFTVFFYYSVWYWPRPNNYSHILPYEFNEYKLKVTSMLEHASQIKNDFMGSDPRPFYQRAVNRDAIFGKKHYYDYCELYYKMNFDSS